jgi:hypothetical protein
MKDLLSLITKIEPKGAEKVTGTFQQQSRWKKLERGGRTGIWNGLDPP